jgi:hypothetical protein
LDCFPINIIDGVVANLKGGVSISFVLCNDTFCAAFADSDFAIANLNALFTDLECAAALPQSVRLFGVRGNEQPFAFLGVGG